jgi:hypothetical protein
MHMQRSVGVHHRRLLYASVPFSMLNYYNRWVQELLASNEPSTVLLDALSYQHLLLLLRCMADKTTYHTLCLSNALSLLVVLHLCTAAVHGMLSLTRDKGCSNKAPESAWPSITSMQRL